MRIFILSAVIQVLIIFSFSSVSVAATAPDADDNLFMPGSSWLVGSSSIVPAAAIGRAKLPCIMMNQYNNGFIVRVSGGGGRVMAMAIDFRQPVFTAGKSYSLDMDIDSGGFSRTVLAKAYDKQTLIFNTRDHTGLYKAMQAGRLLGIKLDKHKMSFAMIGMRDGLVRMESCYGGKNAVPENRGVTAMAEEPVLTPFPGSEDLSGGAMDIDSALSLAARNLQAMEPQAGDAKPRLPVAKKAKPSPAVAHVAVVTKTPTPPVQEPEGERLVKTWGSPFREDVVRGDVMFPQTTDRDMAGIAPAAGKTQNAVVSQNSVMRWRAIRGTNLREVLDSWGSHANVRLLWTAGYDFPIKNSMVLQGTFEEAVLALLNQYETYDVRPGGRIYNDPSVGQKVLLIERYGG